MTYRSTDASCKSCYSQTQSRLNQQIKSAPRDEGCPVLEESGTVCGETDSLNVFLEFKKIYDDSLRKLERSPGGREALKKLAPFQKLIDHLWEQNAMLIETVGELEEEAMCRLADLQDKLNKSCQKIDEYREDINSLITVIHRFCQRGVLDTEGLEFKTICPSYIYGPCENSNNEYEDSDHYEEPCRRVSKVTVYCSDLEMTDYENRIHKPFNDWKKLQNRVAENTSGCSQFKSCCSQSVLDEQVKSDCTGVVCKNKCSCIHMKSPKCVSWQPIQIPECEDIHSTLRTKEREVECLSKELLEKNDLLAKYSCQIEELKNEMQNKCKKFNEVIKRFKTNRHDGINACESNTDENICDSETQDLDKLLYLLVRNVEEQRKSVIFQLQGAECQLRAMASEKKIFLKERNEIANQLQCLKTENEKLVHEIAEQKKTDSGKDDLLKTIETLKMEKNELFEKIKSLQENIQELNTNFKETRWALTSEVAEKHDQVQELRKCVSALEEQLRQADMQTHFKDDIIKELRKELKGLRKSESRGLYDVVKEVRERKSSKKSNISTGQFVCENTKSSMSSGSSCKCPANQYESAKSLVDEKSTHGNEQSENAKLRSEIECLKKCLKARLEQLKEQEEFTRELEEKLIKTKMDLTVLQEKNTKQEGRSVSLGCTSVSDSGYSMHYTLLSCLIHKLEDVLKNLCAKSNCCPNCKISIEKEMEKLRLVKNELEKSKTQNISSETCSADFKSCNELYRYEGKVCSSGHLEDVEKFREKAVTGVAALEKMREQVDILENLIRKQHTNFSCMCDEMQIKECEEKLEKCRSEFDRISGELCALLQNDIKSGLKESLDSFLPLPSATTEASLLSEEICRLKCECARLQKEINKQENLVECLKKTAKDLEQEIRCKRMELVEQTSEIESRACEIIKTRSLIKKICRRMKEQCKSPRAKVLDENPPSPKHSADLNMLFCELKELWCLLETTTGPTTSIDVSQKLTEENEKLKKQLDCLEKCVINKDETMRVLHDTVKLKECHIEELKSKVETVESRSSKLNQDVEEKCRLISNLQEAIRKCKQLEAHRTQVETLQFELCDLDCTLKKYEKEIRRKNSVIEKLHEKLTDITAENLNLTEKISIIEPKLKIVYKTCNLFEQMVCDLQEVIRDKEGEIECLYGKIKDLENELESEFKKCEFRALEDSKCIEELTLRLKNFQNEYTCSQESYSASLAVLESRLKNEEEAGYVREKELLNTISQLKMHLKSVQSQIVNTSAKNEASSRINELEALLKQAESRLQMYDVRMSDLQKALEITAEEREEERNIVLRKLCEEKKENIKNKTLVTELNETIKLISLNEKILKERLENMMEDYENVRIENEELRNEIEAWKKISTDEGNNETNLSELEKLICSLKIQKTELKSKCSNLKAELEKEMKLRKILENRVEDLNTTLQNKFLEFNSIIETYKNTSSRLQQTLTRIKEVEKNFMSMERKMRDSLDCSSDHEHGYFKKLLNIKTAENAKLICQIQILQVDVESKQNESIMVQTSNDAIVGQLRHEICRLENAIQEFQEKSRTLHEENIKLRNELNCTSEKEFSMRMEFREKQKELCAKLRSTICEKNDLLNSLDELQKRLEEICIENLNKEKINKELSEECSRLKSQNDSNDNNFRNKPDKIISQLTKEIKTLHYDLSMLKENYDALDKDYKNLLNDFKCCEKKNCNLEKLYAEVSNENQALMDLKMKYERDLCELNTQNLLLKDKLSSLGDSFRNVEDKQKLYEKIKELTIKVRTLEKSIIPALEEEITSKNCCIENLTMELREANISSQRMRSEATRVMQCTKKYLAAQRCANEALMSRLECSNKRGSVLGAENRELEEQLKAVTRMNEFLLNQLEGNKCDTGETEPRSFSPLPWSCSTVERDTSSSEYLAESGFQSMQPSPTNMEIDYDSQNECKRMSMQWNSSRKSKCGGF